MAQIGSKKTLEMVLSRLEEFDNAKVSVEQYSTSSSIAADVLWDLYMKGIIEGKVSIDLGCGHGILGIGMLLLGAKKVYFVDVDDSVLDICKKNIDKVKSEDYIINNAVFVCKDVVEMDSVIDDIKNDIESESKVDLVVQNPPFGTKVKHIDKVFLDKAFSLGKWVCSFHKSSTRKFVLSFTEDNNFDIVDEKVYAFPIKKSFDFHNKPVANVDVSVFLMKKKV